MMAKITIKTGSPDYMTKGCRWVDTAWDTVYEVERVWKNSIKLRNLATGSTMQASNRHGMTKVNGWYPLRGKLFKRSFDLVQHPVPLSTNVTILRELSDAVRYGR
jgi:hypothetical protein